MLLGLAEELGWHTAQVAVQVASARDVSWMRTDVASSLQDTPELDLLSLEIRVLGRGAAVERPLHEIAGALLVEVLRIQTLNVRTLHVFCAAQEAPCFWPSGGLLELGHLGFRELRRLPRGCGEASGTDAIYESTCHPFRCDLAVGGGNSTAPALREQVAVAVETVRTGAVNIHDPKEARHAADSILEVVRFYAKLGGRDVLRPTAAPNDQAGAEQGGKATLPLPLQLPTCECWAGRLSMRLFPVLLGYQLDSLVEWVEGLRPHPSSPSDFVFALTNSVALVETSPVSGDSGDRELQAEAHRIFGAAADVAMPFWLTSRGSIGFGQLITSGWPVFRTLAYIQLRLSPWGSRSKLEGVTCARPHSEELRQHLWIALEDEQPFAIELTDRFHQAGSAARPTDLGCTLAFASNMLAQAAALQCRAAISWKPRSMSALVLESAQELLEGAFLQDPSGFIRALFYGGWPILQLLSRMERDHGLLRQHLRVLPVSQRTHWVDSRSPLWSKLPPRRTLVSYGGGERALRGGNWASRFAGHLFGDDARFDVREEFPCPDVVIFMGVRPMPNNGVGIYVQAESGRGYAPTGVRGLVYLGPQSDKHNPDGFGAVFDVPFASTSFAFRERASPKDLTLPRPPPPSPTQRRGAVAYLASRCVPHREVHFRALREAFGEEAVALGVCNGTFLENATGTASTPGRSADNFMDASVELLRGFDFAMAYENTNVTGYITEKIVSAYLAGTIPVYWGTPSVKAVFNPESFVYAPDFSAPTELAAFLQRLRGSPQAAAMRRAPALQPGALGRYFSWHRDAEGPLKQVLRSAVLRLLKEVADPDM